MVRDVERFCAAVGLNHFGVRLFKEPWSGQCDIPGIDNWLAPKCQFSGCFAAVPHRAAGFVLRDVRSGTAPLFIMSAMIVCRGVGDICVSWLWRPRS
jgi:hypothetical protein